MSLTKKLCVYSVPRLRNDFLKSVKNKKWKIEKLKLKLKMFKKYHMSVSVLNTPLHFWSMTEICI
jgi:septum formation topological specificity factor MinE